ncbi:BamA/TamA family outer membrane protein [Ancylomarina longa]|nr:BamA/TamA family outer membrane protein [Ancylomarina longa]
MKLIFSEQTFDLSKFFHHDTERFTNEETALKRLENRISRLKESAYIEANVDSLYRKKDSIFALIHIGPKYKWGSYSYFNMDQVSGLLNQRNTFSSMKNGFKMVDVNPNHRAIIQKLSEKGYPFARIEVQQFNIEDKVFNATWKIIPSRYIVWDSVVVKGDNRITKKYLQKYLGINPGKAFSEQDLRRVSGKINALSFVQSLKAPEIEFDKGKARLYTYLDKRPANQFDGIMGIQSNPEKNGKIALTGEINLLLVNSFSAGESIHLNWQKFETESQNLALGLSYPFLIANSVGIDVDFSLQKQDTTYITTKLNFGMRLFQSGRNHLKLFWTSKASHLVATNHFINASQLPDFADVNTNLLGVAYHFENLDYNFNPRKGWNVNFNIAIGKHKIKRNNNLPQHFYEGIPFKQSMLNAGWKWEYNIPLFSKFSYRIKNQGGILSASDLFLNDLFKLGGISNLRGFNEDSFRASKYTVLTSEIRFIPEKNTSLYLFWDGAYYKNELNTDRSVDYPWGIGFGINFGTKSGIFSLNYALGSQNGQNLDFQNAKIHFGMISRF